MIKELQLRILPEEAVNEQSLRQVVARETGEATEKYPGRTCIETFDRRTPANDIVNVKLRVS